MEPNILGVESFNEGYARTCTCCLRQKDAEKDFYHQTRGKGRHDVMQPCKQCKTQIRKIRAQRAKQSVLATYTTGDKIQCVDCGEKRVECLSLYGADGGTNKEREQQTIKYWPRMAKRPYDPAYKVLCLNCSWLTSKYGTSHPAPEAQAEAAA